MAGIGLGLLGSCAAPARPARVVGVADSVAVHPASDPGSEVLRLFGRGILVAVGAVGITLMLSSSKAAHASDDSTGSSTDSSTSEAVQPSLLAPVTDALAPITDALAPVTELLGLGPAAHAQEQNQAITAQAADVSAQTSIGAVPSPSVLAPVTEALAPVTDALAPATEMLSGAEPSAQPEANVALAADLSAETSAGVVPALTPVTESLLGVGSSAQPEATVAQATDATAVAEMSVETPAGVEHESAVPLDASTFLETQPAVDTSTAVDLSTFSSPVTTEVLAATTLIATDQSTDATATTSSDLSQLLATVLAPLDALLAPAGSTQVLASGSDSAAGLTAVLDPITVPLAGLLDPVVALLNPVVALVNPVVELASPVVALVNPVLSPVLGLADPVLGSTMTVLSGTPLVGPVLGDVRLESAVLAFETSEDATIARAPEEASATVTPTAVVVVPSAPAIDLVAVANTLDTALETRSLAVERATAGSSPSAAAIAFGSARGVHYAFGSMAPARLVSSDAAHREGAGGGSLAALWSIPSGSLDAPAQVAAAERGVATSDAAPQQQVSTAVLPSTSGGSGSGSSSSGGSSTYAAALTPAQTSGTTSAEIIHLEDAEVLDGVVARLEPTPE